MGADLWSWESWQLEKLASGKRLAHGGALQQITGSSWPGMKLSRNGLLGGVTDFPPVGGPCRAPVPPLWGLLSHAGLAGSFG